jgi:hypothetical protein
MSERQSATTSKSGDKQVEIETKEDISEYEAPTVVDYGSLRELTAGQSHGTKLDASFPSGTAFADLTFS